MSSTPQPSAIDLCGFKAGLRTPLFLVSGPCVIESRSFTQDIAGHLKELCKTLGINFIFKASYDKANRSSGASFRGPGRDEGLSILNDIRHDLQVPVLTDVHSVAEVADVAAAVDVLQIPAFLCRQTDLIEACAATGRALNIKKGQFLSPREMNQVAHKAHQQNNRSVLVCERGFSFGYNNLVVDMRSLCLLRETGCPVVFDATHSVQLPGAQGNSSGGERRFIPVLARAAVAVGIAGLFMETHPQPDQAKSDGPNAWPLSLMEPLLRQLRDLDQIIKHGMWHEEQIA